MNRFADILLDWGYCVCRQGYSRRLDTLVSTLCTPRLHARVTVLPPTKKEQILRLLLVFE